ncbi:MAG: sensor histidine kinase [Peptostreptococcaceae bacterium]
METLFNESMAMVPRFYSFFIAIPVSLRLGFKLKYRYKSNFINFLIIFLYLLIPKIIVMPTKEHNLILMNAREYGAIESILIILSCMIFMRILFSCNIKIIILDLLLVFNVLMGSFIFSNVLYIFLKEYIIVNSPSLYWVLEFVEKFPILYFNIIFTFISYIILRKGSINQIDIEFLNNSSKSIYKLILLESIIFLILRFTFKIFIIGILLYGAIDFMFTMLLALLSLYVSYILYKIMLDKAQKSHLQSLYNTIEMQFNNQVNHYASLEKYISDTRMIVHDAKHHIFVLNTLLNKNLIEEAKLYINDLHNDLFILENKKICDNKIIEAIIQSNIFECSSKNINLTYNVTVPDNINIDYRDLAIIFGNLLNNAVEATNNIQINSIEKFIDININTIDDKLIANIVNSKENKVIPSGRLFKTTKKYKTNHGIGLSSVNQSISKYNGHINFEDFENTFKVSFFLHLK